LILNCKTIHTCTCIRSLEEKNKGKLPAAATGKGPGKRRPPVHDRFGAMEGVLQEATAHHARPQQLRTCRAAAPGAVALLRRLELHPAPPASLLAPPLRLQLDSATGARGGGAIVVVPLLRPAPGPRTTVREEAPLPTTTVVGSVRRRLRSTPAPCLRPQRCRAYVGRETP
jgi:hypothetical protein